MKETLTDRSKSFSFSKYDIYSTVRDIVLLILTFGIVNIKMIEERMIMENVDPLLIALALFMIVQLARKYLKDYTRK